MLDAELPPAAALSLDLLRWSQRRSPGGGPAVVNPATLAALRRGRIDSLLYLATEPDHTVQRLYDRVWELQRAAALHALAEFTSAGIDAIVFKGAEFLERYFAPHTVSLVADVDFLLHPEQIQAAKAVLYDLGYAQGRFNPDQGRLIPKSVREIATYESNHYELAAFNRSVPLDCTAAELEIAGQWRSHPLWCVDGQAIVVIDLDLHYGVALDVPGDEFFDRAQPSALGSGLAMAVEDQLWFTLSRYYNEVATQGKRSLRDLAYTGAMLGTTAIDWPALEDRAARHNIRPSLYYHLQFLDWLAGGDLVPRETIAALRPSLGSRGRDWGWQLAPLFGTDESFTPAALGAGPPR